jgi:heme-degrading monooxygenase HmoA
MYARNVSIHLKPNMLNDFNKTFEQEVLPLLRKQKGFKDEITFFAPDSNDLIAISLWENKESAEAYNTAGYPEVLKSLAKTFDGAPKVRTSEVIHSTFHKVAPTSATVAA